MSFSGGTGKTKIATILIDTSEGEEAYSDLVNNPDYQILEEKLYGSSLGDMKMIVKYRDKNDLVTQETVKEDPGYSQEEWDKNAEHQSKLSRREGQGSRAPWARMGRQESDCEEI